MEINLHVLPPDIVENYTIQKCLIPASVFRTNDIKPGEIMKCVFAEEGAVICKIYPREIVKEQECCYVDCSVMVNFKQAKAPTDYKMLTQLVKMQNAEVHPEHIEVTLVITEKLFCYNYRRITLKQLQKLVNKLLQPLHLTTNCTVQTEELLKHGVASVKVDIVKSCNENEYFNIDNCTKVHIKDVQLLLAQNKTVLDLNVFEDSLLKLEKILQAVKRSPTRNMRTSVNVLLVGPSGCGKSTLVEHFVNKNYSNCFRITAANVLGQYPGESETNLRLIFEKALFFAQQLKPNSPTIILLEDLHLLCPALKTLSSADTSNAMRLCTQLLILLDDLYKNNYNVICIATTTMPERINELLRRPGRFEREILIPSLSSEKRKSIFGRLFEKSSVGEHYINTVSIALLNFVGKHTQGYVIADLCTLVRSIERQLLRSAIGADLSSVVKSCLNKLQATSLRGSDITVYKTEKGFDSIGGMSKLKRTLFVSILAGLKQHKAYQRFGLTLPKGVLLYGPPGCAKTTFAQCLATEANMTFITTTSAEVYSPYVGCAEKYIAKMFDTARKNAPCLIFLDEIDSLVGCRTISSASTSNDVQVRILSTLLTEMDGIIATTTIDDSSTPDNNHILVVAATNRPDMIDDALLRPGRFDKIIHVPAPDLESRLSIFQLYAKRLPLAVDVNLRDLAERTSKFSGADICSFCNEAAMQAFQRDFETTEISACDFNCVLQTQKSSLSQKQIDWYLEFEHKFKR